MVFLKTTCDLNDLSVILSGLYIVSVTGLNKEMTYKNQQRENMQEMLIRKKNEVSTTIQRLLREKSHKKTLKLSQNFLYNSNFK